MKFPGFLVMLVSLSLLVLTIRNSNHDPRDHLNGISSIFVHAQYSPNPILYEISTRPWLYELSQKYGYKIRLNNIPMQEFQNLKQLGVQYVWLMGMWTIGEYGRCRATDLSMRATDYALNLPDYQMEDIIGSPYQVLQYTVNELEIGTDNDLINLRQKLNAMGLKLMLDFVPNHSAVDNPNVWQNSSLYVLNPPSVSQPYDAYSYLPNGVAYGKDGYFPAWTDTAQFNYWNPQTRTIQLTNLMKVASMADGIRCDMAMLLLNSQINRIWGSQLIARGYNQPSTEFWEWAISAVKQKYPNTIFMAECYWGLNSQLQQLGFDFTYDKDLYDALTTNSNAQNIHNYLLQQPIQYISHSAHFVENHDQARAVANFGSVARANAACAISFSIPGLKFSYFGQWIGKKNPLVVQLRRSTSEPIQPSAVQFYNTFIPLVSNFTTPDAIFSYKTVSQSSAAYRVFAFHWRLPNSGVSYLVTVNYSENQGSGAIVLDDVPNVAGDVPFVDVMNGNTVYMRNAQQVRTSGLFVVLSSYQIQIFKYSSVTPSNLIKRI
ncbi:hypothetical protein C9374_003302 [Naegleria lovaniensis]|uniref:Glycosyl hydrolase family 13 catalytic domain-containing protein n=1 Tax=Naegleria lovaniensis TaxID=51637 RepID=A0AA88GR36_NAELO|nr:uncharacterized protein C9374_003302 [Naegleria lovaniensis]KAG2385487.1 hypothetical protein C9374_003302 [Naegleria lovaniensis]